MENVRTVSTTMIINPFERLRPMETFKEKETVSIDDSLKLFSYPKVDEIQNDIQQEQTGSSSSSNVIGVLPVEISIEQLTDLIDDQNNDSSTSATTNRSIHLPVEKQRGISEIIRKRNSRCKVEDYKKSIQKAASIDDNSSSDRTAANSKIDEELTLFSAQTVPTLSESIETTFHQNERPDLVANKKIQMSIERLNCLLSTEDPNDVENSTNDLEESLSVADKRSLFENFSKDLHFSRRKSEKNDE